MTQAAKMFIDGKWVGAANGATYAVPNPATEETIGTAPDATVDDMQRAIAAARRAFDEGPWTRSTRADRVRALTAIADGMERRKEEMRQLLIAEAGAALHHARRSRSSSRSSCCATTPSWRSRSTSRSRCRPRRPGPDGAAAQLRHRVPPAGRRLRAHPDLELPALRHRAEARAGARHRLHDGLQAVAVGAAHQPAARRDHRRGRPAARRRQLRHRAVERDRRGAGVRSRASTRSASPAASAPARRSWRRRRRR